MINNMMKDKKEELEDPDEEGNILVEDHILIRDKDTGEEYVNKRG